MRTTVFDAYPKPPCAELLGWRLIEAEPDQGFVRIGFEAKRAFCNPAGFVQGGFLAAMLDDTLGPAIFVRSEGRLFTATIDLHVHFLIPAKVGPIFGEARVVQMGKTIAFAEGRLMDENDVILATATASARLVETSKAVASARRAA